MTNIGVENWFLAVLFFLFLFLAALTVLNMLVGIPISMRAIRQFGGHAQGECIIVMIFDAYRLLAIGCCSLAVGHWPLAIVCLDLLVWTLPVCMEITKPFWLSAALYKAATLLYIS